MPVKKKPAVTPRKSTRLASKGTFDKRPVVVVLDDDSSSHTTPDVSHSSPKPATPPVTTFHHPHLHLFPSHLHQPLLHQHHHTHIYHQALVLHLSPTPHLFSLQLWTPFSLSLRIFNPNYTRSKMKFEFPLPLSLIS